MDTPKTWLKITIETSPILVETISDYLVGVHEAGVELVANKDEKPTGTLLCYIQQEGLTTEQAELLFQQISSFSIEMAAVFDVSEPQLAWNFFEEEDWGKNWKKHFTPFAIVPGLVIAPTWEEYEAKVDEKVIVMDPGMAFGTGHHATTSLSLGFVQEVMSIGDHKTVLDVGCGTGILAMGAVLFGAEKVLGLDNDPDAVSAAGANVLYNKQSEQVDIAITSVEDIDGEYDVVVANIIHDVLAALSDALTARTKVGGFLVLSGVLAEDQADSITSIFEQHGFSLVRKAEEGEWAAVLLQKMS